MISEMISEILYEHGNYLGRFISSRIFYMISETISEILNEHGNYLGNFI